MLPGCLMSSGFAVHKGTSLPCLGATGAAILVVVTSGSESGLMTGDGIC